MTDQNSLNGLISAIELAAPSLATLMGGPLGGALANGVVTALQSAGIGSDLPAPVTPSAITPAALESPLSLLQTALSVLDQQASDHLNEVNVAPTTAGAPATLPHSDAGTQVNAADNLARMCITIVGAIVAVVGVNSPATASFLNQFVPVVGGVIAAGLGMFLSHRDVSKSNTNTAAVQSK